MIVPPYTFVATVNAVLLMHALPVFVDSDLETFQIDARKVEAAITTAHARDHPGAPRRLGRRPRHHPADRQPPRHPRGGGRLPGAPRRVARTQGRAPTAAPAASASRRARTSTPREGGAVITSDAALLETCYRFHNNSRGREGSGTDFSYPRTGANLRLTEFQAALLLAQMTRLDAQSKTREQNARLPHEAPRRDPRHRAGADVRGCTRNAYHLYMFRYDSSQFSGLSRALFLKALAAEGIPASGGYSPLNTQPFLEETFATRGFKAIYPTETLKGWRDRNRCPQNDRLCSEAVWLTQTMLLGPRRDMDDIADAMLKVRGHAAQLAKS